MFEKDQCANDTVMSPFPGEIGPRSSAQFGPNGWYWMNRSQVHFRGIAMGQTFHNILGQIN
jgi:hypothetical protein